jgi:hypothetical protein
MTGSNLTMNHRWILVALISLTAAGCTSRHGGSASGGQDKWMEPTLPDQSTLSSTGRNSYFILEPGYQLVLEKDGGKDRLIITVLSDTRIVDGVQTRIVEEYETEGSKVAEISRNYFAISRKTGDVYYLGEDVDTYKDGKITGHGGSWLAGVNGARAGLMMPGKPAVGQRFYQEQAIAVAMDRCEILSTSETVTTPAGKFTNCLKVAESTPLEAGKPEYKLYAPGVGLLADEDFRLVRYGKAEPLK